MTQILGERETTIRFLENPTPENYVSLFQVMIPQVLTYFRLRGCTPDAAEDLAQDVLLTVYRQSAQLRDRNLFRPWLFRIAANALLQHRGKHGKETGHVTTVELDGIAATTTDPLAALQFSQWMKALSGKEREAMVLRYVEGFEYHEIASLLEVPTGTVQWRIFQSIKKLAARFGAKT